MDVLHIKQLNELFQIPNLVEKDLNLKGLEPHWNNITLDEMFSMIKNHGRNHREEFLFNSGKSVQKTLYSISQEATPDQTKDILLRNHSNLKKPSQCMAAYQAIQQEPDEALQIYNTRYESYYQLAHPGLNIDNDASRFS